MVDSCANAKGKRMFITAMATRQGALKTDGENSEKNGVDTKIRDWNAAGQKTRKNLQLGLLYNRKKQVIDIQTE